MVFNRLLDNTKTSYSKREYKPRYIYIYAYANDVIYCKRRNNTREQ